jgi:hypothetical protein
MIQTLTFQTEAAAWQETRLGKFTASEFGCLLSEPRSKADKEAGKLSETAKALVAAKAIERVTGIPSHRTQTSSMRRGTVLEHAAKWILSQQWKPIHDCTFQPLGKNSGATPDGLIGDETLDIKCPEDPVDVFLFGTEVADGNFDELCKWDRNYAWQIMVQAKAAGSKYGNLLYFTDRLPVHPLTEEDRDMAQMIIDKICELQNQDNEYPYHYRFERNGFFYAVRRFELTQERSERIDRVLETAEIECVKMMEQFKELIPASVAA